MLFKMSAAEAKSSLAKKEITASELCESIISRMEVTEPTINAYIEQTPVVARAAAARPVEGSLVSGLPVSIKDNICSSGIATTCASAILSGYVPPYEATATKKLWEMGAGLLGKTNLDEFAMGSSTETSIYGVTRNPHDISRVPGGSSGGSAAAVAAGSALWALGSDTGGSVRAPAAFCGIVGMKPTYGRVSRYGLIAFASSLDQIGPMARSVTDCAMLLTVISGSDPNDATSCARTDTDFASDLFPAAKGLKIGVVKEHLGDGVDPGIRDQILQAIAAFEALGCDIGECSLPHSKYAVASYYLIAPAEASSNLARFDGIRYGLRSDDEDLYELYTGTRSRGFGAEVKRRIMLGTYALSAGYYDDYYHKGQQIRTLIQKDYEQVYSTYDLLLGPTCPLPAFKIGQCCDDPLALYVMDMMTIPANLVGIPAISIPCGKTNGLPVGLQLQAPAFAEKMLLQAALAYEETREPILPIDPRQEVPA